MHRIGKFAPASIWRAFFLWAWLGAAELPAQVPKAPDATEASRLIEQAREADLPGEYYFEFDLIALPKRGEEKTYRGRFWASRNTDGRIKRVELTGADGKPTRFILQSGVRPAVWRWADGKTTTLAGDELLQPLLPAVELTAFDLLMPFLYWPNVRLKGTTAIRGRDAHVFEFTPPVSFDPVKAQIAGARIYLDVVLGNAIVQTELVDKSGRMLKRFSPLSLKTVGKQTVPKAVDYRNDLSGDKARLQFTAVALDLELGPALFAPAALEENIPAPGGGKLVRLE